MPIGQRPQRRNPQAPRLTFWPELESCPVCHHTLVSKGSAVHSHKTIQTLAGEFHVVAYSRRCTNSGCKACGKHFHSGEHLKLSLPYSTYGLDVIARIGIQRQREHKQFAEIQHHLNEQGVAINDTSVGRLYRLFLALMSGNWPQRCEKLQGVVEEYGGLILMCDGLQPDGEGPYLYVLWEVLSGVPISSEFLEPADSAHLSQWLERCDQQLGRDSILAILSDGEPALVTALSEVWPDVVHQLCQMHFLGNLSEPLQKDDLVGEQQLQQDLKGLPRVPDLSEPKAVERLSSWPVVPGEPLKKKDALAPTSAPVSLLPRTDESLNQTVHPLFLQPFNQGDEGPNEWLQRYYGYYRRAIRDALSHSNRKPFQCGGLKAYDQLIAVEAHLHTRQQQLGTDPYLAQLHHRVKAALQSSSELAGSVRQAHTCLRQLEHYLAQVTLPTLPSSSAKPQGQNSLLNLESQLEGCVTTPNCHSEPPLAPKSDDLPLTSSKTVQLMLEQMVDPWQKLAPLKSTLEKVCRKWNSMTGKWLPAILHCYDIPGLPRNNLQLEARFGQLRQNQRRVSGRKETTPLRRMAPGQLLCQTLDDEELLSYLKSVPTDDYWRERRKQEVLEEPQRWLWRLHRDPLKALAQIDTQFSTFLETKAEQRQTLDHDL